MPNDSRRTARDVAALLGVVRTGVGVAVLVAPRWFARALLRDRATADGSAVLARMFGVRDAVLGVGAVVAAGGGARDGAGRGRRSRASTAGAAAVPWVTAGAVSDALDVLTLMTDRRTPLRPVARLLVGSSAAGAAVLGAAAADRLRGG